MPPIIAMVTVLAIGALSRSSLAFLGFFVALGGLTMANTLPTHIAAPRASTKYASKSSPRNMR